VIEKPPTPKEEEIDFNKGDEVKSENDDMETNN